MHDAVSQDAGGRIDDLLGELRAFVAGRAPHLIGLFTTFAQEARFARAWLTQPLAGLAPGATILEVGAGLMLLSCQLRKEGFRVQALEPVGEGFSAFRELQELVLEFAKEHGIHPQVTNTPAEDLVLSGVFDFAFSINVMEHVGDVPRVIERVGISLKPGRTYAFTCPNYLFPYEPHFGIPTLFSRKWTYAVFRRRIQESSRVTDPEGLWRSLNWISVPAIARACRRVAAPRLTCTFDRSLLAVAFERVVRDAEFSARRSPFIRLLASFLVHTRLHWLAKWVPATIQPIISCRITRS